jgi:hypothetical protein
MFVVLGALGASPFFLLSTGDNDEPDPTTAGGQPCIVPANGERLCGHDAAAWCEFGPSVEAGPGLPEEATRDDCVRVARWAAD